MLHACRIALLVTLLAGLTRAAEAPKADDLVHAKLLADLSAVRFGQSFTVGVLLEIKPGWHVYWQNPGDSGLATTVHLSAPDGYAIGPLQYPVPEKFVQAGNEVVYGYTGSVLLMAEIRPPKGGAMLAARAITVDTKANFTADVSFLCCDKQCVQGKAQCQLEMPVGGDADAANQALFAEWKAKLPMPLGAPGAPATGSVSTQPSANGLAVSIVLNWETAPAAVQFFPAPEDALKLTGVTVKTTRNQTQIGLNAAVLKGQTLTGNKLTMVIAAKGAEGAWRGVQVDCPIDSLLSK